LSRQKKARKPGRPKLPKGEAKGHIVPVRFAPEAIKTVEAAAKASNQTVSEWIRSSLTGRYIKTWYAFCPDELHITLFDKRPRQQDSCYGCGVIRELHGVAEGYVSKAEADSGLAQSRPANNPDSKAPPTRL